MNQVFVVLAQMLQSEMATEKTLENIEMNLINTLLTNNNYLFSALKVVLEKMICGVFS